jgi:hypothetical protein
MVFDGSAPPQGYESKLIMNGFREGNAAGETFRFLPVAISVILDGVHQFRPIQTIK